MQKDVILALQKAVADKNALPLKALINTRKLKYQSDMLEWAHEEDNPQALEYIVDAFYGSLRDDDEHIIQTIICNGWIEGLKFLLDKYPEFVNVACYDDEGDVLPLLVFAIDESEDSEMINILVQKNPNLDLTCSFNETIFHKFAYYDLWCMDLEEYLKILIQRVTLKQINAENYWGVTAISLAHSGGNKKFIQLVRERFNEKDAPIIVNLLDQKFIDKPITEASSILDSHFKGQLPVRSPLDLFASIIGKHVKNPGDPCKPRLFINNQVLLLYLDYLLKQNLQHFIVNGLLINMQGGHGLNILISRNSGKEVKLIFLDNLDGNEDLDIIEEDLQSVFEKYKIKMQITKLQASILRGETGCRIIATYVLGKLRHLSPEQIDALIPQCESLDFSDLPANFGFLTICQSMTMINSAKEKIWPDAHNAERLKFEAKLKSRTSHKHSIDYVDSLNKNRNCSLEYKNKNQLNHAKNALHYNLRPLIAELLCLKELQPNNWSTTVDDIIDNYHEWTALAEYDFQPEQKNVKRIKLSSDSEAEQADKNESNFSSGHSFFQTLSDGLKLENISSQDIRAFSQGK